MHAGDLVTAVIAAGLILVGGAACDAVERTGQTTTACTAALEAFDAVGNAESEVPDISNFVRAAAEAENPDLQQLAERAREAADAGDVDAVRDLLEQARATCEREGA